MIAGLLMNVYIHRRVPAHTCYTHTYVHALFTCKQKGLKVKGDEWERERRKGMERAGDKRQ